MVPLALRAVHVRVRAFIHTKGTERETHVQICVCAWCHVMAAECACHLNIMRWQLWGVILRRAYSTQEAPFAHVQDGLNSKYCKGLPPKGFTPVKEAAADFKAGRRFAGMQFVGLTCKAGKTLLCAPCHTT